MGAAPQRRPCSSGRSCEGDARGDSAELRTIEQDRDKLAEERDALLSALDCGAADRDLASLERDGRASKRDQAARRRADEDDPGSADRFLSGSDPDAAAGNRADSVDDRRRAAADRVRAGEHRRRSAQAAERADEKEEQLNQALTSRNVIGQAKGILMERYKITEDVAFEPLVAASQRTHMKLRELAAELADTGQVPSPPRG